MNSDDRIAALRAWGAVLALAALHSLDLSGIWLTAVKYTAYIALTIIAGYRFDTVKARFPKMYTSYCVCLMLALAIVISYVLPSQSQGEWGMIRILTAVIFAPVFEELFFRGALISFKKLPLTCITSSLIFAIFHPGSYFQAFLLGLVLSYFYISSRNIAVPIICHAANNILALLCMRWDVRIPVLAISLTAAVLIYKFGAKYEKKIL